MGKPEGLRGWIPPESCWASSSRQTHMTRPVRRLARGQQTSKKCHIQSVSQSFHLSVIVWMSNWVKVSEWWVSGSEWQWVSEWERLSAWKYPANRKTISNQLNTHFVRTVSCKAGLLLFFIAFGIFHLHGGVIIILSSGYTFTYFYTYPDPTCYNE